MSEGRPDPRLFLWIPASAADVAAVIPYGAKASGWSTFFIYGISIFSIGPRSLPRHPLDCVI